MAVTPGVVAFIASATVRQRPERALRMLQRLDPVHHSPLGIVLLTRHDDVTSVLRNPAFGSDESKADPALLRVGLLERFLGAKKDPSAARPPFLELFDLLMLFRDAPDHTRLRALVSKAFTPRRVQDSDRRIREIAQELLEPHLARRRVDVMRDFAYPFPARVICELLGLPDDGVRLFIEHAPALAIALDPSPMRTTRAVERANAATTTLTAYIQSVVAERRRRPTDDLLSALVHAESDGETLTEDELVATVLLLVIAGHETTANVIGNAMFRLVGDDETREALASLDGASLRTAVEEFLRLDGPVQMAQRVALADLEIGRVQVQRGQIVVPILAAANRDPRVFDSPHVLRLDRSPNPHVAFGLGHHFCIGAPLARLELAVGLGVLAQLPGTLRLATPAVRRRSFTIKGFEALELQW